LDGILDLSRTVGWFTALYPVALPVPQSPDDWALLLAIKARLLGVPRLGIGWGLLRHGPNHNDRATLAAMPEPAVSFNYLGRFTDEAAQWTVRTDLDLPTQAEENRRPFALDVVALIADGRLTVRWFHSNRRHDTATIEAWAARFAETLRGLLARCNAGERADLPADFPLALLDARGLAALLAAVPATVEDIYPLSPLQQGMLFHALERPEDGVYVEQLTGTLTGNLDEARFEAAWNDVIARHAVLRSVFVWDRLAEPHQVVLRVAAMTLYRLDWCGPAATEDDIEDRFQALLARDRRLGLALDRAPLMRFTLIRTATGVHRWIWTHHHILLDGWSLPVLFGEVLAAYEARCAGHPLPTAPMERPYRDHIAGLRARTSDAAFWRSTLSEVTAPCRLELHDDAEADTEGHPGAIDRTLAAPLADALSALARRERVTLNTIMVGAWALLLERFGCGRTVTFGVTVSGRSSDLPGVETMIGLFINTLPLAVRIDDDAPLGDWLRAIQARQMELQEHDNDRLVDIQRWIGLPGDEPLFDTLFVFENYPVAAALNRSAAGIAVGDIRFLERTNYPLTLAVIPDTRTILRLNHDGRHFGPDRARALLDGLERLLVAMTVRPDDAIGRLTPLSAEQAAAATRGWTGHRMAAAAPVPMHRLIEAQADLRPNARALASASGTLGYAALDTAANQLAHRLIAAGVGPEVVVAVVLPRSAALVVTVLAVLKAGGAWLPLDRAYPVDRLRHMLEDSGAALILSHGPPPEGLADMLASNALDHIDLSAEASAIVSAPKTRPAVAVDPDNLAYIIYTSGSTGRPKGVLVPHAGIANLASVQAREFAIAPADLEFQFASPSFDASVAEMVSALATGATLGLPPDGAAPDALEGIRQAADLGTTHITLPPSLAAVLGPTDLPGLKTLVLAGEAAPAALFRRWAAHARVINAYGPTEATVCAAIEDCSTLVGEPTIGRAIDGCALYLLDARGDPVPDGVPGEIHIGGVGLARGYCGRPDLTAAAFLPDPFATVAGARMYRTGDLGVRTTDGKIRFLGRGDHQIKLRGFRIELGEVEAVLNSHPATASAVALTARNAAGQPELTAAVMRRTGMEVAPGDLRQTAADALPAHMVPTRVLVLDAFPLTPNGKVDRQALEHLMVAAVSDAVDPMDGPPTDTDAPTDIEILLAAIWSETFNGTPVGRHDNFFALGGDSILSLQIVSRARAAGIDIAPRQIFAHQTVATLAAVAIRARPVARDPEPNQAEIPLTPVQRWFFAQDWPAPHHWNQSLSFAVDPEIDADALERALAIVQRRHDAFRLRFTTSPSGWRQVYDGPAQPVVLQRFDLSGLSVGDRAAAMDRHADAVQGTMDLAAGRTFIAALFEPGPGLPRVLLLAAHHLVIDAVSWRVLLGDLHAAYRQAAGGYAVLSPAAGASYRLWAERLCQDALRGRWTAEADRWLAIVAPPTVTLRADGEPADGDRVAEERVVRISLPAPRTAVLLRQAGSGRVLEPLLAALSIALADQCDGPSLTFDMEGHGRGGGPHDAGLDGADLTVADTVGWFTTIYPIRLALDAEGDPAQALRTARGALEAIPGDGLGWGVLRHLGPDPALAARLAAAPARPVSFNYLGQTDGTATALDGFTPRTAPLGKERDGRQSLPHRLAINGRIEDGRLTMGWSFDHRRFRPDTVERLAQRYVAALETVLAHLEGLGSDDRHLDPQRFGHVDLDAGAFDALLSDLDIDLT
jgi:amino acid adenylation domain-containing protein/non-ribosomal peptide synthase protein (TIGR01720 family)